MAGPKISGTHLESDLSSLSSFSNLTLSTSRKRKIRNKYIVRRGETQLLLEESRILLEGCDWPVGNLPSELTTNRRTVRTKRKCDGKIESERGVLTKKQRGDWSQ